MEGHPTEAGEARMQTSIHVKVVGLVAGPKGHVPTYMLSRTSPDLLASRNVEGTLRKLNGEGRHERSIQVCSTKLDTVDTTLMMMERNIMGDLIEKLFKALK